MRFFAFEVVLAGSLGAKEGASARLHSFGCLVDFRLLQLRTELLVHLLGDDQMLVGHWQSRKGAIVSTNSC